jgi:hypothetical protein
MPGSTSCEANDCLWVQIASGQKRGVRSLDRSHAGCGNEPRKVDGHGGRVCSLNTRAVGASSIFETMERTNDPETVRCGICLDGWLSARWIDPSCSRFCRWFGLLSDEALWGFAEGAIGGDLTIGRKLRLVFHGLNRLSENGNTIGGCGRLRDLVTPRLASSSAVAWLAWGRRDRLASELAFRGGRFGGGVLERRGEQGGVLPIGDTPSRRRAG